jgi:hypothetical protein
VGEFLGAGLAGLGAGIGEGIKKFQQNKEEAKELRANLKRLRSFIPKEQQDEFDAQVEAGSLSDLRGLKRGILERGELELQQLRKQEAEEQLATSKFARQTMEEEGKLYRDYFGMMQPQQVEEDFGPQIGAAERRLQEAERAGFRPEFTFPESAAQIPQGAERFAQKPPQQEIVPPKFLGAYPYARELTKFVSDAQKAGAGFGGLGGFGGAGFYSAPSRFKAPAQQQERPAPLLSMPPVLQEPQPAEPIAQPQTAPAQPMGPEPALEPSPEVQQAARDLEAIRIQAAEGGTRLETSEEVMKRISENIPELAQKYPTQAKNLYEMLYPKQDKLTPSEQIAMMKLQREVQASEVAGYGVAPSVQIAQDFREFAIPTQEGIEKLDELIKIAEKGISGKLNPTDRSKAQSIQARLMGELRTQIVGAGAVSETEWGILKTVIPDVTKLMSFSGVNVKLLNNLKSDLSAKLTNRAKSISWSPLQGTTGQAQRPMSRTVSYGMSGKPVMQ